MSEGKWMFWDAAGTALIIFALFAGLGSCNYLSSRGSGECPPVQRGAHS